MNRSMPVADEGILPSAQKHMTLIRVAFAKSMYNQISVYQVLNFTVIIDSGDRRFEHRDFESNKVERNQ